MKIKFALIKLIGSLLLSASSFFAMAQAFQGPSDATSAPPANVSAVAKVLFCGNQITLKGPVDDSGNIKYQWYKTDSTGTKKMVKEGVNKDNIYTETTTRAGYYTYQLVQVSAGGCSSTPSDLFQIYALPVLSPTISSTLASVCTGNKTMPTLQVQGLDKKYSYTYQWTNNGTPITSGGNSDKYTPTTLSSNTTYAVTVAYTLSPGKPQTASKTINVFAVPAKPTIIVQVNN